MKLIYTNIVEPKFQVTGHYAIDIPESFEEAHGEQMEQYIKKSLEIQDAIHNQKKLLGSLKDSFVKEIKETNPEYFL